MGLALLIALGVLATIMPASTRLVKDPEDLRAFYCAGQTMLAHHDPYLAEPLRSCEVREIRAAGMAPYVGLALPAPLPAFALVPFALLSLLPFALASTLYVLLLVVAMAATAILIARLTAFPLSATIAALILSDGLITVLNGQIFPFALLALCASAFELSRGGYVRASIYAALAAIEPHVALPALVSLGYSLPRTRVPIALALTALAGLALLALGLGENLEYVLRVLPAHARSESTAGGQYSLTSLLYHAGMTRDRAIFIGNVQYALMCAFGVVVAQRLARAYDAPELYALVPPAFALLGGPFIHLTQMAVAVPALLALAHRIPERRTLFGIALLLAVIPWQDIVENDTFMAIGSIAAISGIVAIAFWRPNYRVAIIAIVAMIALGGFERTLRVAYPPAKSDPTRAIDAVAQSDRLAEATWEAFVETTQSGNAGRYLAVRLPTWIAVLVLIGGSVAAVSRRRVPSDASRHGVASPIAVGVRASEVPGPANRPGA